MMRRCLENLRVHEITSLVKILVALACLLSMVYICVAPSVGLPETVLGPHHGFNLLLLVAFSMVGGVLAALKMAPRVHALHCSDAIVAFIPRDSHVLLLRC
jgi:hypothetical protein